MPAISDFSVGQLCVQLGTISADKDIPVFEAPHKVKVESAGIIVSANVTASATDYVTLTLKQGTTQIAQMDTTSTGFTAYTKRSFSITADKGLLTEGEQIRLQVARTGTAPPDLADLLLVVKFSWRE